MSTVKDRNAYDSTIVLWNAATGQRLRELHTLDAPIARLAFAPDGYRLAAAYVISGEHFGVVVFDVESGKTLRNQSDFKSEMDNLQFSADGKRLWASDRRGSVRAWDAASGKQLRLWNPPAHLPSTGEKVRAFRISSTARF